MDARLLSVGNISLSDSERTEQNPGLMSAGSSVLATWRECLALLDKQAQHGLSISSEEPEAFQKVQESLLQQLEASCHDSAGSPQLVSPSCTTHCETVASLRNPLTYFRELAARPPALCTETCTALELTRKYTEMVFDVSMRLHLLGVATASGLAAMGHIKDAVDRYLHTLVSVAMAGRQDIIDAFVMTNCDTLDVVRPEVSLANQVALTSTLAPHLGLTEQQQEAIAVGVAFFESMMNPDFFDWQQCKKEPAHHSSSSSSGSGSSSDDSSSCSIDAVACMDNGPTSPEVLQQQQMQRKRFVILIATSAWLVGCMTWVQLAKLAVHGWPLPVALYQLALAIKQQRDEQLQQQWQP